MEHESKIKAIKTCAWILGILIFLGAAFAAGWYFFKKDLANPHSKIAKPLLTSTLKKMMSDASDGLYHIQYLKFNLDINSGNGLITGFKLIPDSTILQKIIATHRAPNNVFKVSIDSLVLKNFGFVKTKNGKRFTIGTMSIYHPVVRIINKNRQFVDTINKHPCS